MDKFDKRCILTVVITVILILMCLGSVKLSGNNNQTHQAKANINLYQNIKKK